MTKQEAIDPAPTRVVDATVVPIWTLHSAVQVAMVMGLVIAGVGTLTSRVDIVILALPFIATIPIALDQRPRVGLPGTMWVDLWRTEGVGSAGQFEYRCTITAPAGAAFISLRVTEQNSFDTELILATRDLGEVTGSLPIVHSGRQKVVEISYRLISADAGWLSVPTHPTMVERVVAPAIPLVESIPLPHRLTGLTGVHRSARAGDGGEFRDLHPYAPGDRLRRIDWKATARRSQGFGDLYVRRTDATSDATVILVIDSREVVAERVEEWSSRSSESAGLCSMDLAREAASSLAVAAISMGDRVGLIDLSAHAGVVTAGGGKRHLERLLRRIALSRPSGVPLTRRRAPLVPAGAIVYLLSAFLDDDVTSIAMHWRAAGHRVVAVDVLPTPILERSAQYTRIAHRIVMAERRRRLADARANGVELFRWQEDAEQPSRVVAIRTLARAGRGQR